MSKEVKVVTKVYRTDKGRTAVKSWLENGKGSSVAKCVKCGAAVSNPEHKLCYSCFKKVNR